MNDLEKKDMLRDTILGWKALYGIVVIRFILIILSFLLRFLAELVDTIYKAILKSVLKGE